MTGPRVTSGTDSRQDYSTPADFIAAVEKRFGKITFDLAAHAGNAKARNWFGPDGLCEDALSVKWPHEGLLWLNPPFADIGPWAKKCATESATIAFLVPAAVGSNWFRDYVAPYADVHLLNGRLSFDGKNLYPKDTILALYGGTGIKIWNWKKDVTYTAWGII